MIATKGINFERPIQQVDTRRAQVKQMPHVLSTALLLQMAYSSSVDAATKAAALRSLRAEPVEDLAVADCLGREIDQAAVLAENARRMQGMEHYNPATTRVVMGGQFYSSGTYVTPDGRVALLTDVGSVREENQDTVIFAVLADGREVYIVADGMGGHGDGEKASLAVADGFLFALECGRTVEEAISFANYQAAICVPAKLKLDPLTGQPEKDKKGLPVWNKSGATLIAAVYDPHTKQTQIAEVGDSRAKLVRKDKTVHLSWEHSVQYVSLAMQKNIRPHLPVDEAEIIALDNEPVSPMIGTAITSAIGADNMHGETINNPSSVTTLAMTLVPAQGRTILLLYSDGALRGNVTEQDLTDIAKDPSLTPQEITERIKAFAIAQGSNDNITVIAVDLGEVTIGTAQPYFFDRSVEKSDIRALAPQFDFSKLGGICDDYGYWLVFKKTTKITDIKALATGLPQNIIDLLIKAYQERTLPIYQGDAQQELGAAQKEIFRLKAQLATLQAQAGKPAAASQQPQLSPLGNQIQGLKADQHKWLLERLRQVTQMTAGQIAAKPVAEQLITLQNNPICQTVRAEVIERLVTSEDRMQELNDIRQKKMPVLSDLAADLMIVRLCWELRKDGADGGRKAIVSWVKQYAAQNLLVRIAQQSLGCFVGDLSDFGHILTTADIVIREEFKRFVRYLTSS